MAPSHQVKDTRSYSEQFDDLKGNKDLKIFENAYPKPDRDRNALAPGAYRIPFSNVWAVKKDRPMLAAEPKTYTPEAATKRLRQVYAQRYFGLIGMHAVSFLLAPFFFSWTGVLAALLTWSFTHCLGITLGFHRLLTHRSFKTFKVIEYFVAWLGSQAAQGDPIEWVSHHRLHHIHTDTPLDPHTPYEGFWFSHMGWFSDAKAAVERPLLDHANVPELTSQKFYHFLESTWFWQLIVRHLITQYFFGTWAVCWTLAVPTVWGWHVTFLVNSAAHIWGRQPYETGDLSTNNWWVALLTFGEGWHNAHHAFPFSARHGLEWWELDFTWMVICTMKFFGLAWDLQLPSEKQKDARRKKPEAKADAKVVIKKKGDGRKQA